MAENSDAVPYQDSNMDSNAAWREAWQVEEQQEGELPTAWHRSGLCFQIEYDDIAWVFWSAEISESRAKELELEMGQPAFSEFEKELYRQLGVVWRERGYTNFDSRRMDVTAPWRAEWALHPGTAAVANAVHSSGFGLTIETDVDMGHVPVWWAVEAENFAAVHASIKREMGDEAYDRFRWKRIKEALELWYALGAENGICPTNVFGTPLDSNARPAPDQRQNAS